MKDDQKARVYRAEDAVTEPYECTLSELRNHAALADRLVSIYRGFEGAVTVQLGDETGAEKDGSITVTEDDCSVLTMAHEVAHLCTWGCAGGDHGPLFCAAYLHMARELGCWGLAAELAYQFGKHGVKVEGYSG